MRKFALAAVAVFALAAPLGACTSTDLKVTSTGIVAGPVTPEQAQAVAQAEVAYTAAVQLGTVWLKSGKATASQARTAVALEKALYAALVAARTAVANGDSPGAAAALALMGSALPAFTGYIKSQ